MNILTHDMSEEEDEIRELLDPDVVEKVQSLDDGNVFNLNIVVSGLNINIMQHQPEGPVVVISQITPGADTLANLIDRDADRKHLQNLVGSVFTNTPGVYNFLDMDGNPCGFDEMHTLQIQYRIYQDALSEHTLMNGVMDIASALVFFRNSVVQFGDNLDDQR